MFPKRSEHKGKEVWILYIGEIREGPMAGFIIWKAGCC